MANKSAKLIKHARHEWSINQPRDYQPLKEEILCFSISILGLVHKSGIKFLVLLFKHFVNTPTLYCRLGRSFNSQLGKYEYQRKKSVPNSKYENKPPCQVKVCASWRVEKKLQSKG